MAELIPGWVLIVLALAVLVAWVVGASIVYGAWGSVEHQDSKAKR